MLKKTMLCAALLAAITLNPAIAGQKKSNAGGNAGQAPGPMTVKLTKEECRQLGGTVKRDKGCKGGGGYSCKTESQNQETGNTEFHNVCIDEVQ